MIISTRSLAPQPGILRAIGAVWKTFEQRSAEPNYRCFELRTTVYKISSEGFKNAPMPQQNSLLSLVGEAMDVGTHEESKMVAILLHDITYYRPKTRHKARLPPLEHPMLQLVLWIHLPNDEVGIVGLFGNDTNPERKTLCFYTIRKSSAVASRRSVHPQPRWRHLLRIAWNSS